jgi:hypothetical protein
MEMTLWKYSGAIIIDFNMKYEHRYVAICNRLLLIFCSVRVSTDGIKLKQSRCAVDVSTKAILVS